MPRGYLCIVFATFGWLILCTNPAQAAKTKETQIDRRISDTQSNIAATYDEQAERAKRPPCGPHRYQSTNDLCAQWKAADAAADAAGWAAWGTWLSGFSLFAVAVAIILTIESNRIARNATKQQLRPYIGIEPHGINVVEDGRCRVPLDVTNRGQTPAHKVMVFSKFAITADPIEFDPATQGGFGIVGERGDMTLGPGENRFIFAYLHEEFAVPHWDKIETKDMAIVHFGYVVYTDNFHEIHETHYAFYHYGEELSDVTSLRCRLGNYST